MMKTNVPYSILGRFYDRLTPQAPGMNRHARGKILGALLPRLHTVCDLGCGSGSTAVELALAGHKVYAVDASATQCRHARDKCRRAGVKVKVIKADMRRFRLPEPVDLVLCEFNPLNHLGRKGDLAVVFKQVSRALVAGGRFYFDVNMRPTYKELYPVTRWEEQEGFGVLSRGKFDHRRERAWIELDWFIADGNKWRRYREHIEDCWWSGGEIRSALKQAGFGGVRSWDGSTVRPKTIKPKPQPGFDRYYLARKAE